MTSSSPFQHEEFSKDTVLIAGGGPVGLLLARVLSHFGIRSVLLERNETTTKWPKMDLTNARSMEILRRLGLSDGHRELGVPSGKSHNVLVSTGLGANEPITQWLLPSVDDFRERIMKSRDGTQPWEPWQRMSQVKFEAWLKRLCEADDMIDARFGWKVENVQEEGGLVTTTATIMKTGETRKLVSRYVVGCDGASSVVRRSLELPLDGGPTPTCVLLVHFKSKDLTRLQAQGQFWHIFFLHRPGAFAGAMIAQDEIDTWTVHWFLPLGTNTDSIASEEAIYTVLGGLYGKYEIEIDEILVRSVWRPSIAVARTWASTSQKIFIAGDAAHQNIPTGGYGMNMGIGDAYNLGWKLAAAIQYGGAGLLSSYEAERRPVAVRSIEHSGQHMQVHQSVAQFFEGVDDAAIIDGPTPQGRALRQKIHEYYQAHDGENQDFGIEMGYIYTSSIIYPTESEESKPIWQASDYTPSTWPGSRAPHVWLSDGSAIFEHLGKHWSLVTFKATDSDASLILSAASSLSMPIKHIDLRHEKQARKLWERDLVLVRPDEHVAWRSDSVSDLDDAIRVLEIAIGMRLARPVEKVLPSEARVLSEKFTATTEMKTQVQSYELDQMAEFQQ
ncbi:FAD-binding domain-containing protein [Paraphoma chrysanthemicola]|uniref:FAD-binding domain-containing protein n=1 Tax=Paraphoma chrysanthemicola TaxID=798071 RepID=A0A8K0RCZ8_9PLEO|nr:FAD-binding domain-containing protein [Paraphoma chrysanthemicola]